MDNENNPYFELEDNPGYELPNIIENMPEGFRTEWLNEEQLKIIDAAYLHSRNSKDILLNGISSVSQIFASITQEENSDTNTEKLLHFSKDAVRNLGLLLSFISGIILFLLEFEGEMRNILLRHKHAYAQA